ncbi:hypothetical protein ABAC460_05765 [Asticcacaulis sp. AC460]|nr:hypothetical protein ABAC460_05765 [Asticcacaulis sp. AC460]
MWWWGDLLIAQSRFDISPDTLGDFIRIAEHFSRMDAINFDSLRVQPSITAFILVGIMKSAIDFDAEPYPMTVKVEDIWAFGMLSTKGNAVTVATF